MTRTFDDTAVVAGKPSDSNRYVQGQFPFVNCYIHELSSVRECIVFFQTLLGLAAFFRCSNSEVLDTCSLIEVHSFFNQFTFIIYQIEIT